MAIGKLFIGRKVRDLRLASGTTQSQFAERIGISTSYLNQIENNQRPVSAAVLLALADKFRLDIAELSVGENDRLLSALSEALTDPLFETYTPSLQELKLVTQNAPGLAHALIACHQAYRRSSERLASFDATLGRAGGPADTHGPALPDILRFGFTPLYLRFVDVWDAVEHLVQVAARGEYREERFNRRAAVT